jgi:hypothetical protein
MKQYIDKSNRLLKVLHDYKKDWPIDSVDYKDAPKYLKGKEYLITGKIDGEMSLVYYSRKQDLCYLLSKNGRIRTDLPVTNELRTMLDGKKVNELIAVGELYVQEKPGKVTSYPKAISILRAPKDPEDENKIHLMIFDIISIDGKDYLKEPIFDRINLVQRMFKGTKVHPITIFQTEDFNKAWRTVLKEKDMWEGLVIVFEDGSRIKVKPTLTVDLAVVGVEVSKSDPSKMGALQLAYMNEEGLFIFDSKVGSGFTDKEREEWLEWAEEHEVSRKGRMIYVDPFEDPRIVEVEAREIHIEEGPGMKFDRKNKRWVYVDDYPVGTLRQPSFKRVREDKQLTSEDLRITQVLLPDITKRSSKLIPIVSERFSYIISKDKDLLEKCANLLNGIVYPVDDVFCLQVDLGNDEYIGYKPGDRVVSIAKGIKGTIIDYEQIWCPNCNVQTIPLPRRNFPMFSVFYLCPECGNYLERTDIDYLILWDEPIDEGYLYVSEAHPTEIKKISSAWLITSGLKPGTEQDVVIESEFGKLTKKQIYDYFNSIKDKLPFGSKIFIVVKTDKGPVLKRNTDGKPMILTEELFNEINHGRTVEIHKVIDNKNIDYFFVDIDPREEVPFKKVKQVTKDLYEFLEGWDMVKDLSVQFSGNRGFHILGKLKQKMDVDDLRHTLINLLEEFISTSGYTGLTTGITHDPKMIRLDVSTLKHNGSIKIPYSLSWKTGLIALPVKIEKIDEFEKEDAKITNFIKKGYRNTDFRNLIGYEGRFVIHDHFTYRRNRNHFDLRLEVPIERVRS